LRRELGHQIDSLLAAERCAIGSDFIDEFGP
jgi:hypothetical protein